MMQTATIQNITIDQYIYLGVQLTKDRNEVGEIKRRIQATNSLLFDPADLKSQLHTQKSQTPTPQDEEEVSHYLGIIPTAY